MLRIINMINVSSRYRLVENDIVCLIKYVLFHNLMANGIHLAYYKYCPEDSNPLYYSFA